VTSAQLIENAYKYNPNFDLIPAGTLFNEWSVLEYCGHSQYLCRCSCGTISRVSSVDLRKSVRTKCRRCQIGFSEHEASFNYIYSRYKQNASKSGREFSLSKEHARQLFESDCHYCGSKPKNKYTGRWAKDKMTATFYYNGIDRIDNDLGYTLDNCLPCCKICNHMKHVLSYEEFLAHIKAVYEHRRESSD